MDAIRFGRQFRALRVRLERRQSDVSADSGLSRSLIATIDRGQIEGVTIGSLVRAAHALGAEVVVRLRWRGEQLDRLLDEAHSALVDAMVARLKRHGWVVDVEVSFSIWGERGSIDILAFHPAFGALLVIEVKSVVADTQATLHGLDRKARLARQIVKERLWNIRHVSRLLVVGASATSRRRVARLAGTYEVVLPARGTTVRRWLVRPAEALDGLLFLAIDSRGSTRRRSPGRERVRRPRKPLAVSAQDQPPA
jgi:transcriptional regulator with XRE-family HTH domain